MSKALVFAIEEFSVFDGPGIRTSVFLKGCPLRCSWCHNPEGQGFENSILRSPNGCVNCGECLRRSVRSGDGVKFTEASVQGCPQGLLRYCAVEYSAEELCARLEKNLKILNGAGGGITFSGGEPTANPEFLLECLTLLEGKTNRALQTCGYCSESLFARLLESCDYMLFDVKLADDECHKRYTGVSNKPILKNLKALASSGLPFVIRTPLIPSVTDTEENIRGIAEILKSYKINYIELLPYNRAAGAKYALTGRSYTPDFDPDGEICTGEKIFAEYGIEARVM